MRPVLISPFIIIFYWNLMCGETLAPQWTVFCPCSVLQAEEKGGNIYCSSKLSLGPGLGTVQVLRGSGKGWCRPGRVGLQT